MTTQRVLSVQSHVASGYVGNRAATFPLQYLGYDVDVINSCQLSCHTGYDSCPGYKLSADQLEAIFEGLHSNHLDDYDRILTGYIPGGDGLKVVAKWIRSIMEGKEHAIYLLDPVMGDSGRLYVHADVVDIYKDMLDLATIVTPNHFELELLSGGPIKSTRSLKDALIHIHRDRRVPHIILSSTSLALTGLKDAAAPLEYAQMLPNPLPEMYTPAEAPGGLLCLASSWSNDQQTAWAFKLPTIETSDFTGVGDFFSAMVLAHFDPHSPNPLRSAVARATLLVQQLLLQTYLHSISASDSANKADVAHDPNQATSGVDRAKRIRPRELRLIQYADQLKAPGEWPSQPVDLTFSEVSR